MASKKFAFKKKKFQKSSKKHVESMFLTTKEKNYPYYFLKSSLNKTENNCKKFFKFNLNNNLYFIRSLSSCSLELSHFKSIVRIFKWFVKFYKIENSLNLKLFVFPDFSFTSKPKDIRMGKGKGEVSKKIAIIKKGQIILSLSSKSLNFEKFLITSLLKKMIYKLPKKFIIFKNDW